MDYDEAEAYEVAASKGRAIYYVHLLKLDGAQENPALRTLPEAP